jgi:cephalosporin-C deacetylase-like acetyl esterase
MPWWMVKVKTKKQYTVKPVYNDHARSWTSLVVMDRWSIQVNYIGKTQGGRREHVVASTGNRYIQVVAKADLDCI